MGTLFLNVDVPTLFAEAVAERHGRIIFLSSSKNFFQVRAAIFMKKTPLLRLRLTVPRSAGVRNSWLGSKILSSCDWALLSVGAVRAITPS